MIKGLRTQGGTGTFQHIHGQGKFQCVITNQGAGLPRDQKDKISGKKLLFHFYSFPFISKFFRIRHFCRRLYFHIFHITRQMFYGCHGAGSRHAGHQKKCRMKDVNSRQYLTHDTGDDNSGYDGDRHRCFQKADP